MQLLIHIVFCPYPKSVLVKTCSNSIAKDVLGNALRYVYDLPESDYFQLSIPDGMILNPNKQLDQQGIHDEMELNLEAKIKSQERHFYEIGGFLPMFSN